MAAKKESSMKNMLLTLVLVTAFASLALGGVYVLTKDRIDEAKAQKLKDAISIVLPAFETLEARSVMPETGKDSLRFYIAKNGEEIVGTAIETYTDEGFSGRFTVMVGFLPTGTINDSTILGHKETPGLGDKMEKKKNPAFTEQFKQKDPTTYTVKVGKDGGDVDAITAATISSRAFCDAVNRAYNAYKKEGGEQ
jgi:electron transport complex protein RnfG